MDEAKQPAAMDPQPAESQTHRPKRLTDLPNEIPSRICGYLVPDHSDSTPFGADEIHATMIPARQGVVADILDLIGNETHTARYTPGDWTGGGDRLDFQPLKAPSTVTKERASNGLASFAATCRHFNIHVR
ncbi:hypothetical protein CLAIMM_05058 [Cladophialophora immunda]|nr:hypothetical protein CLAIMM_05058 [Cladophialophora immunda]